MSDYFVEKYDLLINGVPSQIGLFDADDPDYKEMDIYLSDFKVVRDLPLLQKMVWLFFDNFTNAHPFGGFPAFYLRIGIDDLADVFYEDMDDIEKAIECLIQKKRLLVFEEKDKVRAYAAI